jgi:nucleoside phosphorylase
LAISQALSCKRETLKGKIMRAEGNTGVQNTGSGTINIDRSAIGDRAAVYVGQEPREAAKNSVSGDARSADIGIITVLSEETRAMTTALARAGSLRKRVCDDGSRCHEADIDLHGNSVRVVLTQAADRGQRPMVIAFERLRRYCDPAIVVLVGIAGGVHPAIRLGDVVVVQEVIYYDMRKETSAGTFRRGHARPIPVAVRHAINDFFSSNGEPYRTSVVDPRGVARPCSVLPGPIGSGEAVVADADSEIRRYIAGFNDKTLAVETEAGGLAEAFYEMADGPASSGWLAVRGISDHADAEKNDEYHEIAAWHAAVILLRLLPYLVREDRSHSSVSWPAS